MSQPAGHLCEIINPLIPTVAIQL